MSERHYADEAVAGQREWGERIELRLREMIDELDCKIRYFDALLGGVDLASQMVPSALTQASCSGLRLTTDGCFKEWSHSSCENTKATSQDKGQMKAVAIVGMLFLPATLLSVSPCG